MARDGQATRTKILDGALELILDRGYGGMSLDQVIASAEVTKGAFYHHFRGKSELALALVERFAEADLAHYHDTMERAARLNDDPLQQILIAIGLMIEELDDPASAPTGCLYASFCYQAGLFDDPVIEVVRGALRYWSEKLGERFTVAMEKYPPKRPVDPHELADNFLVAFEGGFVMARSLDDPSQLARALLRYREYVELLFSR